MAFFAPMLSTWYTLNDGTVVSLNDISKFATFSQHWKNDQRTQLQYEIKDGDLPHQISNRLYGTVDYWWTVLLFNDIWDFNSQWPRNPGQVDDYIASKYPDNNPFDAHHYISPNGLVADLLSMKLQYNVTSDADAIRLGNLEAISIYDYEHALNDLKRNIIVIDPDSIQSVQREYEDLMAGISNG
jgi:hypothetical protein